MENKFSHIADIYQIAQAKGWKVKNFNTTPRFNAKGEYNYVELALIVPVIKEPSTLENKLNQIEQEVEEIDNDQLN